MRVAWVDATLCNYTNGQRWCARGVAHHGAHRDVNGVFFPVVSAPDPINHSAHYKRGGIEAIDVIEAWGLGFHLGNALEYFFRAGHNGDRLEDLKKARWYIDREITNAEGRK